MSDDVPSPVPPHEGSSSSDHSHPIHSSPRKTRLPRACTARPATRFQPESLAAERRPSVRRDKDETPASRIVTPLVGTPPAGQLPRWGLRSMWELASLINFLHVFRPLLNITVEFSAEELETALITPNSTLDGIHIPLLKAIPPVARMALGRATWVTVLCRKLKEWWHWVADGEIPIVASHGEEIEAYKTLEPGIRLCILKALCDIRVEQEDIRNYIDDSLKHGIQLSAFRRERIGGDSHGISYWYEDDPIIGHRLYREIRHFEVKKGKAKGSQVPPLASYQWETVATNLDEFQEVSDKLLSSKNRTEISLGKRLKIDIFPEIEKNHKRKERVLKKQHRQALLLDSFMIGDGISSGRSLRDRRPVTYTFDDYDRSINEAIQITKKRQSSSEHIVRKEVIPKLEASSNGKWTDTSQVPQQGSYDAESPKSNGYEETEGEHQETDGEHQETDGEHQVEPLDRSNRRRKRPQRYSQQEFVEAISDNEAGIDSDDDIVGEAVYDEEYLRSRKQKKASSSSEGDEEYRWEDNAEDEEEEEEEALSSSEDSDEHDHYKKLPTRSRRATKLRSVDDLQSGLRRSKRSTRPRINYRQIELSDSDADSTKPNKPKVSDGVSDASNDMEFSAPSRDSPDEEDGEEMKDRKVDQEFAETVEKEPCQSVEKTDGPGPEFEGARRRRFLDLNELAPGTCFDDGPGMMKDENEDNL